MKFFCKYFKTLCLSLAIFSSVLSPVSAEEGFLRMDISTSRYMSMTNPIKRIAISDPDIATVVQIPASNNEFLIVAHNIINMRSDFVPVHLQSVAFVDVGVGLEWQEI